MKFIDWIESESKYFRNLLESKKDEEIPLVIDEFPVMSCKLASLLFCYHIFSKWPNAVIYGVYGYAENKDGKENISHYWLELNGMALDITADQYNIIDGNELNQKIIKNRPFNSIYWGEIGRLPQYTTFRMHEKEKLEYGFPDFHRDFVEELHQSHKQLTC